VPARELLTDTYRVYRVGAVTHHEVAPCRELKLDKQRVGSDGGGCSCVSAIPKELFSETTAKAKRTSAKNSVRFAGVQGTR